MKSLSFLSKVLSGLVIVGAGGGGAGFGIGSFFPKKEEPNNHVSGSSTKDTKLEKTLADSSEIEGLGNKKQDDDISSQDEIVEVSETEIMGFICRTTKSRGGETKQSCFPK
ncbi:hypothetical protein [Mycoplasma suis]|uniref:Uncharacterized protein n=1 Tax=Mycoplasma suis (strain Illinois) TaxID=768700 RepID=F0QS06_MYCSL|nr:hypothetical protein [Mycoplasma suis]ADX98276.1 hypothetical protein MSU_0751 [Mycoplasma suis str. Illinois]